MISLIVTQMFVLLKVLKTSRSCAVVEIVFQSWKLTTEPSVVQSGA